MRWTFPLTHSMVVRITNARDLARAVITVKEKKHTGSCYVKPVDVRMLQEKGILIDLIEECTTKWKPAPLLLGFQYHSEHSSASMHEIMERRNDRVKEFYSRAGLTMGTFPSIRK